ncbi:MAG: glycosyltransferase [Dehalococcoidia bacterium]
MKVALVHEYFSTLGGSEAVALTLRERFPHAPLYTLVADPAHMERGPLKDAEVHTSFLQRLPFSHHLYWAYYPLFPLAVERLDLREHDVVISSSHGWVKNVLTRPGALHICYCHTPLRWAWEGVEPGGRFLGPFKALAGVFMHYVRVWDASATPRVDLFVANSREVAQRIRRYYGREAQVVYPPIDTDYFLPGNQDGEYFLLVSRLVPYKRVDLAIEAFNHLGLPLKVVGSGREMGRLRRLAGPTVELLGWQPRERLRQLYAGCRALILPGKEDLGMTSLEAQATGRPVIAYGAGGALETVVPGETGVLFPSQRVEALMVAIGHFNGMVWDKERIRHHALQFDRRVFLERMEQLVWEAWGNHIAEAGEPREPLSVTGARQ